MLTPSQCAYVHDTLFVQLTQSNEPHQLHNMSCHIDFAFLHKTISTMCIFTSNRVPATNHMDSDTSQGTENGSLVIADMGRGTTNACDSRAVSLTLPFMPSFSHQRTTLLKCTRCGCMSNMTVAFERLQNATSTSFTALT